ncbi:MAG: hypothetical protein IK077_15960 [Thermoguttaceae bacterium]|nr:hypothetical protein [Thermoguttaceae bacterium]
MKKIRFALFVLSLLTTATFLENGSAAEPQMKKESYTIVKTDATPDWSKVPVLQIDNVQWLDDVGIRARGQLCYSDEALFVRLSAVEKDVRAEHTAPLSPVCEDSCLEFFFKIVDAPSYFNFEINPNGCLCLQFGPYRSDRIDVVKSNAKEYFDIHVNRTTDGWEVFYTIPLKFIRLFYPDYQFKGELAANFYKCGDKTAKKHYLSWSPIDLQSPNFHCPEYFGTITFAP